jgi:hypothetical protein
LGFLANLNKYLLVMGIPGLLVISLLDSAAIPLAGGPDAVIMLLSWQRPALPGSLSCRRPSDPPSGA